MIDLSHQFKHFTVRCFGLRKLIFVTAAIFLLCAGCEQPKPFGGASLTPEEKAAKRATESKISDLILAEDSTLDIASELDIIKKWCQTATTESEIPTGLKSLKTVTGLRNVDDIVEQIEQGLKTANTSDTPDGFVYKFNCPIASKPFAKPVNPWLPITKLGVTWRGMKLGVLKAEFVGGDKKMYLVETVSEAAGTDKHGKVYGLNGHQALTFRSAGEGLWTLIGWKQHDLTIRVAAQPLFTNVVEQAFVEPEALARAQQSVKQEMLIKAADTEKGSIVPPKPEHAQWVATDSASDFPAVSVVDYDNDGLDDLYLTGRWGPTLMMRNNGAGTFKEVTKECGLYFDFQVNTALFADFDNDGDADVIIGRAAEFSRYMINDNGVFKDATQTHTNLGRLFFVSGISVTDVNRDGLLDVYLSTYPPLRNGPNWPYVFIGKQEREIYERYKKDGDYYTNLRGPSNVLLMNRGGGKLERQPFDEAISQWRYSFQSIWADLDNDGDDDVYICNDFGPDGMLRNDTPKGADKPVLVDVVDAWIPPNAKAFGMGGSWGDFDGDGDLDLYVSNMYSKAGNRIMDFIGEVNPILKMSAFGNFLFENVDGKFVQKAGKGKDQYRVNKVGWSYGGQWADFDNNGCLDLYVPSGYYTPPEEIATKVDL
jgi:hypothetical protein